jgi:hypothetical protein
MQLSIEVNVITSYLKYILQDVWNMTIHNIKQEIILRETRIGGSGSRLA